ncbi:S-adenosyl-L-methionine-dependent methyltransferase [Podospora aff. communis PSN243]|uniref:S-adenosyl-L-methionine-dependent methyltransferase n=1 Tax=Podospora aff. communis PSN243 TaxID=3040156 RepID=A0AAV9GSR4_9PEZI|nr:S-adenosyl-L-methionine-dependent methyltransferase [Podospora aff. communis PSN243]
MSCHCDDLITPILRYREQNGRSVHQDGNGYHFISEQGENRRLDVQHHLWYLTLDGKLSLAPLAESNGSTHCVLDLGTGTGLWATDFAEEHPTSEITAVDIKQTNPRFNPPNVTFSTFNYESHWTFPHKFNYIHSRMANSSVADWPSYLRKAFSALTPGGHLELQEFHLATSSDDSLPPTSPLATAMSLISTSASKSGRPLVDLSALPSLLAAAGFVDITVAFEGRWPSNGDWPDDEKEKELGRWNHINFVSGVGGFLAWFLPGLGWKGEEIERLVEEVEVDVRNGGKKAFWPVVVVWGRKPPDAV